MTRVHNKTEGMKNEPIEEKLRYIGVKPTAASGRIDQHTNSKAV